MSINMIKSIVTSVYKISHPGQTIRCISFNFRSKVKPTEGTELQPVPEEHLTPRIQRGPLPIITNRELDYLPTKRLVRQAWVENLDTVEAEKLGLVDLHPDIFGVFPRIDIIHQNVRWQKMYKFINWDKSQSRAERPGGGRKPWPQKGLGKARHGSIRSPLWLGGGKAHGPRGPVTYFSMLPFRTRIFGLCSTLSIKFAQGDVKIVDTLEIPSMDPKFMEDLVEERGWGLSVLFVDNTDIMPKNIAIATNNLDPMNLMPVYGLNVHSMLKHETLVLTLDALNRIEERLIYHINRADCITPQKKFHWGIR